MKNRLLFLFLLIFAGVQAQVPHEPEFDRLLTLNRYYEILQRMDSLQKEGKDISSLAYYGGKANEGIMRYNQAYAYYLKWYESDTTQLLAQLTLARIAGLAGHRKEAIKRYEQLAQQDSLNFTVNYSLGRLYQQSGRAADALQVYRRQWEIDTTNITLLTRMGDCLADVGLVVQAYPLYLQAFDLDVQNSGLAVKMVNGLLTNRDLIPIFGEVVEWAVDTVAALSPALTNLRQSQGMLKYILKKYLEAQLIFTDLLGQEPVSKITYKFLGFSLSQQQRYQQALRYLRTADSLYRDVEGSLTDLEVGMKYAEALCRTWRAKQALEILEEVWNKLQPDPRALSQVFLYKGMALSVQGKKEDAVKAYWNAYRENGQNKTALSNFAYMTSSQWSVAKENKTEADYRQIWYAQILFLQNIEEKEEREDSQHNYSRKILEEALETLFFTGETQLSVKDPDGKTQVYPVEDIRRLIKKE